MKQKVVYTSALRYAKRVRILWDAYTDGSLYIGIYTMSGEPYADITTNLGGCDYPYGYIEKDSEAEAFVKEQKLGEVFPLVTGHGMKEYHFCKFNMEDNS